MKNQIKGKIMMKKHLLLLAFSVATSLAFADDYVGQNGFRIPDGYVSTNGFVHFDWSKFVLERERLDLVKQSRGMFEFKMSRDSLEIFDNAICFMRDAESMKYCGDINSKSRVIVDCSKNTVVFNKPSPSPSNSQPSKLVNQEITSPKMLSYTSDKQGTQARLDNLVSITCRK
jgi:pullulanase/glycogen debranching enzyme